MSFLYFDHAATSFPKPSACIEQMSAFLKNQVGTIRRRGYPTQHPTENIVDHTRTLIHSLINGDPNDQIIFTASSTEAVNMVLQGFLNEGEHVITSPFEHSSVSRTLTALSKKRNVQFSIAKPNSSGMITAKELRKLKRDNTKMLALNYGSNVTGNVIIANDVGTWAAKEQIAYFLDVSQSIGSYPLDVSILQPDFMAFSGHKSLLGPTGVGCLFMKQRTQLPLYRYGGTGSRSMKDWIEPIRASDYETGTLNVLGIVGLKTSIEYILNIGLQNYIEHKRNLTTYFLSKIRNIDNIKIYNDFRHHQLPIVLLNIHNITPQLVAQILDQEHQIITRSGLHCAPWAHKEMGTYPDGTVRMSFGYTHSFDNIDRLINAILDIQRKFKGNWL